MNKNKIIFAIIWAIILVLVIFAALNLRSSEPKQQAASSWNSFDIWILWDEEAWFTEFLTGFKQANPKYANKTNITVESFSDYDSYFYSLVSAFAKWEWPDIFVLNNSEQSVLEDNIIGIDPGLISPSDFRKAYKWVFWDDLISRTWEGVEFLKWIPVWYESLWVFYNRRYFKSADFTSWTSLASATEKLAEKNKWKLIPIALWSSNSTTHASSIFTQLLALPWESWLDKVSTQNLSQALQTYESYGDESGDNWYNTLVSNNPWKSDLDLFSLWEVAAVVWYPRTLQQIDEKWYRSTFLLATPFPSYAWVDHNTLIDYNYFVINKSSNDPDLAISLLSYMTTDDGAEGYLDSFPYYLPARISLEDDMLEEKVDDWYNVVYKDFYDRSSILTSFNKWIKQIYDRDVVSILSDWSLSQSRFNELKASILCKSSKALTLENLSWNCN